MTSRERLLTAVSGGKPDRVPVSTYELVGFNSHSFENNEDSYKKLMDVIRKKTDCVCMWNPPSNETAAYSSYPVTVNSASKRTGNYTDTFLSLQTPKGELNSVRRVYDNVHTSWQYNHLCKSNEDFDKLLSVPFEPLIYDASGYERIKSEVGDNGIIMATVPDPAEFPMLSMEFGDALVWAMTETEQLGCVMAEVHRRNMINLENMLKTCPVDLYRICGSETMTPPYLPPHFFSLFLKPYLKEMIDLIHSYGALARIHCHGKVDRVLDDILFSGADALDPCEAPPDGDIDLAALKKRTAGRLCLFGNLQLKLLETAAVSEVKGAVKKCMDDAKEGGGYVIMPTAAPINVPLSAKTEENYIAFIETALEYGAY